MLSVALSVVRCVLCVVCCLLNGVGSVIYALFGVRWLVSVARRFLFNLCCLLRWCALFAGCCLLRGCVCCLMLCVLRWWLLVVR